MPGRGAMGAEGFLAPRREHGFAGDIVLEINTRKAPTARSARPTCASRWTFAREHFPVAAP